MPAPPKIFATMSERKRKSNTTLWVAIGAIVLIILLLVWLTVADFFGDTDVSACISHSMLA